MRLRYSMLLALLSGILTTELLAVDDRMLRIAERAWRRGACAVVNLRDAGWLTVAAGREPFSSKEACIPNPASVPESWDMGTASMGD